MSETTTCVKEDDSTEVLLGEYYTWKPKTIALKIQAQEDLKETLDKYDYMVSVACGAVGGLIDALFVGSPRFSKLGSWTDSMTDKLVIKAAKLMGWTPQKNGEGTINQAIAFLQRKFPVNYDQRLSGDVAGAVKLSTRNHHIKSLAHSPSLVGLLFSIINQFTSTSTFVENGRLVTVNTETFELQGGTLATKLLCGIGNWVGHLLSDVAGSSGRVEGGRGSGIPIPYFELLQFCDFGNFSEKEGQRTVSDLAVKMFEHGYDMRHFATMKIPVMVTNFSIKLFWGIRRYYWKKCKLSDCVPIALIHPDLRAMLLIGTGVFCAIDGAEAGVWATLRHPEGGLLGFLVRLNYPAWVQLVSLGLEEICYRLGLDFGFQRTLGAYLVLNAALDEYLGQLEQIDLERFKAEVQACREAIAELEFRGGEVTLESLERVYRKLNIPDPRGNHSMTELMTTKDPSVRLVFR